MTRTLNKKGKNYYVLHEKGNSMMCKFNRIFKYKKYDYRPVKMQKTQETPKMTAKIFKKPFSKLTCILFF